MPNDRFTLSMSGFHVSGSILGMGFDGRAIERCATCCSYDCALSTA